MPVNQVLYGLTCTAAGSVITWAIPTVLAATRGRLLRRQLAGQCRWECVPTKGYTPVHAPRCPCGLRQTPGREALSQLR